MLLGAVDQRRRIHFPGPRVSRWPVSAPMQPYSQQRHVLRARCFVLGRRVRLARDDALEKLFFLSLGGSDSKPRRGYRIN